MARDEYEPNRVLGIPLAKHPHARRDEESQRVMGFSADWSDGIDLDWLKSLAHPIRGYKRWQRRRRLGPYATDDDLQQLVLAAPFLGTAKSKPGKSVGDEGGDGAWAAKVAHSPDWISV